MNRKTYRQYEDYENYLDKTEKEFQGQEELALPKTAAAEVVVPGSVPHHSIDSVITKSISKGLGGLTNIFSALEIDDIIILVLIGVLIMEQQKDDFLIIVLAFLFLSNFF